MQCARTKSNADGTRCARPSVYKVHNTFYRYYIALLKSASPKDKLLELFPANSVGVDAGATYILPRNGLVSGRCSGEETVGLNCPS